MTALRTILVPALLIAVVATLLTACSVFDGGRNDSLDGSWTLEQLDAGEGLAPPIPSHVPSMTLDAGEVTGTSGVNTFFGHYTWNRDGSLSFGPLTYTEIGGPPEAMAQEAALFEALQAVTRFEFADTKLLLSDDDARVLLVFVPD